MINTDNINDDFKSCQTSSDYEQFVLKYNTTQPGHKLVVEAKRLISENAVRKNEAINPMLLSLFGVLAIAAAVGLVMLGISMEGEPADNVYHGEHGDYKITNFKSMLGPIGLFGGIALGCIGIYLLINGVIGCLKRV